MDWFNLVKPAHSPPPEPEDEDEDEDERLPLTTTDFQGVKWIG